MNGLKKFFGKSDVEVFESGKKSAEQAKQQEKARKPKSSKWKKYLAVGASLAILGFATPLGAEKEGLANDFQGNNPLKANTIEMTSNIASGNSSTLLAMNDVSENSGQTIQDDNPLTKEQKKELKKLYKKQANEAYIILSRALTEINDDSKERCIIIDKGILDKRYKKELAKAEEKNSNITEKAKEKIKTDVTVAMEYEVAYTLWFASHSKTGCAMAKTALDKGWRFGLMPEKLQEARPGAAATTDFKNKIIYVKSIADRKAYLEKEENKDKRKPYDKLEKEDFKDDVTELSDLEKNIRAAQVWDISHELRHAWQHKNGIGLSYSEGSATDKPIMTIPEMDADNENTYNVKSLINIHRTMEADAETHAVLVAWELNELMKLEGEGQFDLSRTFKLQKASDNRKVMPKAFEEVIAGDKMAITDDGKVADAAAATFKAWHEMETKDEKGNIIFLKDRYDAQLIDYFAKKGSVFDYIFDKGIICYDWDFDRKFEAKKFAEAFKIAGRNDTKYLSNIENNDKSKGEITDFYYEGLNKEGFYRKDFLRDKNGEILRDEEGKPKKGIVLQNNFEFFKKWFDGRADWSFTEVRLGKTRDDSYLKTPYKDAKNLSNPNKASSIDEKSFKQEKIANEKFVRKKQDNRIKTALRIRRYGRS